MKFFSSDSKENSYLNIDWKNVSLSVVIIHTPYAPFQ